MTTEKSLPAFLEAHTKEEKASFHMPGHKGSAFFARLGYYISGVADIDITEIPGADDLRHASGVIKAISDRYAALYGSRRSFLSVNGSSALIMAAVMSQVERGHKIITASNCHISVMNGISLAWAEAVYTKPEDLFCLGGAETDGEGSVLSTPCSVEERKENNAGGGAVNAIPGGIDKDDVSRMLDRYDDADAVILTSPDYFGITSDIEAIADTVHKHGKVLIVDQAHGAHLMMFSAAGIDSVPAPAEECGADIVIDSTHKTMASFTQSAVAHIFGDRVDPDRYEQALLMLESTSPSYILMDSLAVNADIMEKHGNELAEMWRSDLDHFYGEARGIRGIDVLTRDKVRSATRSGISDLDETKIVIDFSRLGLTGREAGEALIEKGIYPELSTGSIVMCLTGIGNVRDDYKALLKALGEINDRK